MVEVCGTLKSQVLTNCLFLLLGRSDGCERIVGNPEAIQTGIWGIAATSALG